MRDFLATLPTLRTPRDREMAASALGKVEAAVTQFATRVYLELPADQKMAAMSAMQDPAAALPLVRYLLKRTRLASSVRRQMAFSREEVDACVAYAAGEHARFDAVAASVAAGGAVRRRASRPGGRAGALQPAARSMCMLVAWLDAGVNQGEGSAATRPLWISAPFVKNSICRAGRAWRRRGSLLPGTVPHCA